jgi:NAD(P)H-hydrate epimerase
MASLLQEPAPGTVFVFDRRSGRALDRSATEEFGIPGIVLMENAAIALCEAALMLLNLRPGPQGVPAATAPAAVIVCGSGNNGGDGYALARHMHNAGAAVSLVPLDHPRTRTDAAVNRAICRCMRLPERSALDLEAVLRGADLLIDAIFGTGLDRPVDGAAAQAIAAINAWHADTGLPVLAADLPSGLDADTGRELGIAVRATMTVTFAGLKPGLLTPGGREFAGVVRVAGIGAPRELLERLGKRMTSNE